MRLFFLFLLPLLGAAQIVSLCDQEGGRTTLFGEAQCTQKRLRYTAPANWGGCDLIEEGDDFVVATATRPCMGDEALFELCAADTKGPRLLESRPSLYRSVARGHQRGPMEWQPLATVVLDIDQERTVWSSKDWSPMVTRKAIEAVDFDRVGPRRARFVCRSFECSFELDGVSRPIPVEWGRRDIPNAVELFVTDASMRLRSVYIDSTNFSGPFQAPHEVKVTKTENSMIFTGFARDTSLPGSIDIQFELEGGSKGGVRCFGISISSCPFCDRNERGFYGKPPNVQATGRLPPVTSDFDVERYIQASFKDADVMRDLHDLFVPQKDMHEVAWRTLADGRILATSSHPDASGNAVLKGTLKRDFDVTLFFRPIPSNGVDDNDAVGLIIGQGSTARALMWGASYFRASAPGATWTTFPTHRDGWSVGVNTLRASCSKGVCFVELNNRRIENAFAATSGPLTIRTRSQNVIFGPLVSKDSFILRRKRSTAACVSWSASSDDTPSGTIAVPTGITVSPGSCTLATTSVVGVTNVVAVDGPCVGLPIQVWGSDAICFPTGQTLHEYTTGGVYVGPSTSTIGAVLRVYIDTDGTPGIQGADLDLGPVGLDSFNVPVAGDLYVRMRGESAPPSLISVENVCVSTTTTATTTSTTLTTTTSTSISVTSGATEAPIRSSDAFIIVYLSVLLAILLVGTLVPMISMCQTSRFVKIASQ